MRAPVPVPDGLGPGGRFPEWTGTRPRLLLLDVDGTLVRDEPVPSAPILAAVGRLTAAGIQVGLATGRMAAASDAMLATGAFTGPHVFHNGAVVADGDGNEQIVLGLDDDEVTAMLAFGRTRDDLSIEVYVGRTYLADRDDPRARPHAELLRHPPSGRITAVADLAGRPAVKVVAVCFGPEAADAVVGAATDVGLSAGPAASPATPALRYVNVTRGGVDKGTGALAAAASVDLRPAQVAAIGDETNDLPMLASVGTAIAMGDAGASVRDVAHLVAPRFEDGGTVTALEALAALVGSGADPAAQRAPGTW